MRVGKKTFMTAVSLPLELKEELRHYPEGPSAFVRDAISEYLRNKTITEQWRARFFIEAKWYRRHGISSMDVVERNKKFLDAKRRFEDIKSEGMNEWFKLEEEYEDEVLLADRLEAEFEARVAENRRKYKK